MNSSKELTDIYKTLMEQNEQWFQAFMGNYSKEQHEYWTKQLYQTLEQVGVNLGKIQQQWMNVQMQFFQDQLALWNSFITRNNENYTPVITPDKNDKRFADPQWSENPIFDFLKQSYLLSSRWLLDSVNNIELTPEQRKKSIFFIKQYLDALSPTNFAATNPEVIRLAVETNGQSLMDGFKNLMKDIEKGRITMTDESAFEVGKNLAITPGAVVYENELMQLIQYSPTTEQVYEIPLLIIPPWINKFYILDLQPENSFVRHCLDSGFTTFIVSWKNVPESMGHISWEDYMDKGALTAMDVVKKITKSEKVNALGFCIGGTLLGSVLAALTAQNKNYVESATFLTTMLDFSDTGDVSVYVDKNQVEKREMELSEKGVMSGKAMSDTFSQLRANDLIWSYVVNNYLKGKTPPPFDLLYWNSDSTNLPAKMYTYYLRNMYLENNLRKPACLTLLNQPIDLSKVTTPSYILATAEDHIAPWKTCFATTELFSGETEFVLGASGHIAGVVNPAKKNKRHYNINGEKGKGADHWLKTSQKVEGSWWNHWTKWLSNHGGNQIPARTTLGNDEFTFIEAAPGRYVKERIS